MRPRSAAPNRTRPERHTPMHPYHIKEFTNERTASKLRSAERHALVADARASQRDDEPRPATGSRGFRIPWIKWGPRMQPTRPARAGH
jgi:hypothetical protein